MDPMSAKAKGYAFMEMADRKGAERAIAALNGIMFNGRKLEVKIKEEKPRQQQKQEHRFQRKKPV